MNKELLEITREVAEQLAGGDTSGDGSRSQKGLGSTVKIRSLPDDQLIEVLAQLGVHAKIVRRT